MNLRRRAGHAGSASDQSVESEDLVGEARARRVRPPSSRDQAVSALGAALFLGAAVPLALLSDADRDFSVATAVALIVTYALVSRVEFELGTGSIVPTQLVLVPMLFLLPAGAVPLCVLAGLLLDYAVGALRGQVSPGRVIVVPTSAFHAIGPALVLVLAGQGPPDLGRWPVYLGALAAQFAFDFGSAAGRDWLAFGVRPLVDLRVMASVYLVDAALAPLGFLAAFASGEWPYAFLLVLPLLGILLVFARERRARIDHALELSHAYRGTAFLLGDVIEAEDEYTGSHSRDVVSITLAVADELGVSPADLRDAEFAALLHDVGKIRVPEEILRKAGPLTQEEREVMNRHTLEGERLLSQVGGLLGHVGHIVRSCHERWDGGGYPDGLAGEEIPLVARVVACCDAYNAMTTTRPYRAALSPEAAAAELRANAGTQFDPRVVAALLRTVEQEAPDPLPAREPGGALELLAPDGYGLDLRADTSRHVAEA